MTQNIEEISATQGASRLEEGAYLLDVREDFEWSGGHIDGAHHIPLSQIPTEVENLPKDRQIVVICKVGGRSAQATGFLKERGYDAVNMHGGMLAWADSGLPFQDEHGNAGTVV